MRYFLTFAVAALLALTATGSGKTGVAYADVDTSLRGSYDQLVIGALGINAPVNVRNVGDDGQMGEPAGKAMASCWSPARRRSISKQSSS